MVVYLLLAITGCILCLILTPIVGRAATSIGLLDAPNARKVHTVSVPRLGGLAVGLAAAGALGLVPMMFAVPARDLDPVAPILAGGTIVFAAGLADDVLSLRPLTKLVAQVAAAGLVMWSGLLVERVTLAGTSWTLGVLAWPVTLAWIVGVTNAFNLIDGIDGLAAGTAVISGLACAVILIMRGHAAEAMLLCALVGAAAGFLAFNFTPASIFLGDSGSLLIGFVLATTAITGWQKGATALASGVPLLMFALPLADLASTLVRRATGRRGEHAPVRGLLSRLVEPDREHIHHRLLALGWSTRATVLLLYGVTILLSFLALATSDIG